MENNIVDVINESINNPIIASMCTRKRTTTFKEQQQMEKNFSRMIGYCILFKNANEIEEYMKLEDNEKQMQFIKEKVAKCLNIHESDIDNKSKEIYLYIFKNFISDGYVFHAANSLSVQKKMTEGLSGKGSTNEHLKELQHIASIYSKYGNDNPLGWGIIDLNLKRNGWFYDGNPKNALYYADSPEWFSQFCGGNHAYGYGLVPDECRHGYSNRDYQTSLETVTALIDKNKMSDEDKKEVLDFFNKCWNKFADTKPCLMLVPLKEIKEIESIEEMQERLERNSDMTEIALRVILEQVIKGCVESYSNDVCCHKDINPENLSYVDLSPILPRYKIIRNTEKDLTLNECIKMLRGFDLKSLKQAQEFLKSITDDEKEK